MNATAKPTWRGMCLCLLCCVCLAAGCRKTDGPPPQPGVKQTKPAQDLGGIPPELLAEFPSETLAQSRAEGGPEDVLQWHRRTLAGAYIRHGHLGKAWNPSAIQALEVCARMWAETNLSRGEVERLAAEVSTNATAAVQAGCKDPLIVHLQICPTIPQPTSLTADEAYRLAENLARDAKAIEKTSYPAIRKFDVQLHATSFIRTTFGSGGAFSRAKPPEWRELNEWAMTSLHRALEDSQTPISVVDRACTDMLVEFQWYTQARTTHSIYLIKKLEETWPDEAFTHAFKGLFHIDYAWQARGMGYANTVKDDGWKLMAERLAIAESALEQAWKLNPKDVRIPIGMLRVELGQGRGRDRMEQWFQRAMAIDPKSYDACWVKLNYLMPKWYGSERETLAFGRACATNEIHGSYVALLLAEAHHDLAHQLDSDKREAYWKQLHVWPDIDAVFSRYLKENPGVEPQTQYYARYAAWCGQWDVFNRVLPAIKKVNPVHFGGQDEFKRMVERGREWAASNSGQSGPAR